MHTEGSLHCGVVGGAERRAAREGISGESWGEGLWRVCRNAALFMIDQDRPARACKKDAEAVFMRVRAHRRYLIASLPCKIDGARNLAAVAREGIRIFQMSGVEKDEQPLPTHCLD